MLDLDYASIYKGYKGKSQHEFMRLLKWEVIADDYHIADIREMSFDTVFDFGANIGLVSGVFASLWPSTKIYAYEPVDQTFALLASNVSKFNNVQPLKVGIGMGDKLEYIYRRRSGYLDQNFISGDKMPDSLDCKIIGRLHSVPIWKAMENKAKGKYLIKMDIEGNEDSVFFTERGSEILHGCEAMLFEIHCGGGKFFVGKPSKEEYREKLKEFSNTHRVTIHKEYPEALVGSMVRI